MTFHSMGETVDILGTEDPHRGCACAEHDVCGYDL